MLVRALRTLTFQKKYRVPGTETAVFECTPDEYEEIAKYVVEVKEAPVDVGQHDFPDDFPHAKKLVAAGITSVAQARAVEDLTQVSGIGEPSAEQIRAALAELDEE